MSEADTVTATAEATAPAATAAPCEYAPIGYSIIEGERAGWAYLADPAPEPVPVWPPDGFITGTGFARALAENRQGYDTEQAALAQWQRDATLRVYRDAPRVAAVRPVLVPPSAEDAAEQQARAYLARIAPGVALDDEPAATRALAAFNEAHDEQPAEIDPVMDEPAGDAQGMPGPAGTDLSPVTTAVLGAADGVLTPADGKADRDPAAGVPGPAVHALNGDQVRPAGDAPAEDKDSTEGEQA